ncbi:cell division cycle 20 cdc20 fizzy -related [Anaeramoeba ignava]|uniref:Cell division cycle 20 cdc20 fizzy -related n=1 Tax=Anaeramoeba ignava TaxID=1746090 RepID=A0A9Q0LTY7_ANAIG|nr:cell division cycle 20 cdc20 fizzy -related [Anaeramoeba ignava]|eukprot:Anaeramoba_ignava/c7448_g1_i1.p1 GENE.c7448_g1_i1~~c7448_g1_i1.p1  ORF type:complete len:482 (+),score=78.84 c7448_g1_i1:46-1491(+)
MRTFYSKQKKFPKTDRIKNPHQETKRQQNMKLEAKKRILDRFIPQREEKPSDLFTITYETEESKKTKKKKNGRRLGCLYENETKQCDLKRGGKDGGEEEGKIYRDLLSSEVLGRQGAYKDGVLRFMGNDPAEDTSPFSLSPLNRSSEGILRPQETRGRRRRKIPAHPVRVLDAPMIEDDFYLNLMDWSSTDFLAVGILKFVFLLNVKTGAVTRICELGSGDKISSLSWHPSGSHLAIGTHNGYLHYWDVAESRLVRTFNEHQLRVGCLTWSGNLLCSGSRDQRVIIRDIRAKKKTSILEHHTQEICSLKWSSDGSKLASGGNDNTVYISDAKSPLPLMKLEGHQAAVKALSWSPHSPNLLATGGGTADRTLKIWNIDSARLLGSFDTGSQICNLFWSPLANEIVTTHGFSQNQIMVWDFPSMDILTSMVAHSSRVLYLTASPNGDTIATAAGDEKIKFWNLFPQSPKNLLGNTLPGYQEIR